MYIIAAGRLTSLDRYLGKDIWLLARVKFKLSQYSSITSTRYGYIRLVSKETEEHNTIYTFNFVPLERVSRLGICYCNQEYMDRALSQTYTAKSYDINLMSPVECLATDEFFEIEEEAAGE